MGGWDFLILWIFFEEKEWEIGNEKKDGLMERRCGWVLGWEIPIKACHLS